MLIFVCVEGFMMDMRFKFLLIFCSIFIIEQKTISFAQLLDSTNLPIFIIDTRGQAIVDEPKINADLKIVYHSNKYDHVNDTPNIYDGNIGIEIRGRYSAMLPQKPFGLETRDSLGENLNVPLFHMPPENDWILLANYNDKTFMRNSLTFELFRQMGHYAPRTQFCEVILNGFYQGIYIFTEKIKRDKNRVDIAVLDQYDNSGDDVTGGYIFKIDYYDETNSWKSLYSPIGHSDKIVYFVYHYPDAKDITNDQKAYIKQFVNLMETEMYSFGSQRFIDRISNYIDINSFIDYFLLNELARNVDAYKKSSYFYKDRKNNGGRIHAGPVWDFDWAWKNINECFFGATDGSGWAFTVHQCDIWPVPPSWTVKLMNDVHFKRQAKDRYLALRNTIFSETYIFNYIDSVALVLDEAQKRHYQKWQILGFNVGVPEVEFQTITYEGEITKFKDWISKRLNWLDTQFTSVLVTGLDDQDTKNLQNRSDLRLYPNPVQSELKIESDKKILDISVYTHNGQLIKQIHYTNTINVRDLSSGMYFIKVFYNEGSSLVDKFIKK
jgi:hypothetical protein